MTTHVSARTRGVIRWMMRGVLGLWGSIALASWAGCSADDAPIAPAPDGGDSAAAIDPCDAFTTSGAPCDVVSSRVCFPLCANGGCRCVAAASGDGGVWACVTDTSCFPDGAPDLDDPPPRDAADDSSDADGSEG